MATRRQGRPTEQVLVSPSERTTLQQWTRRRTTAQGLAQRARIILACAAGRTDTAIAGDLALTRQTVSRWRRRFQARRLDGLVDEPRPGAPRKITDAMVERVIAETLETTPRDATHWSTRTLAKQVPVSRAQVVPAEVEGKLRGALIPYRKINIRSAVRDPRTFPDVSWMISVLHQYGRRRSALPRY